MEPTSSTRDAVQESGGLDPKGVMAFVAALALPGLGHLILGKWARGLLVFALLLGTVALGLAINGKMWTYSESVLSIFYTFADLGTGLIYVVCWLTRLGFEAQPNSPVFANSPTFEYGTHLICVAGLLNYLVALDAYDIAVKRKD